MLSAVCRVGETAIGEDHQRRNVDKMMFAEEGA